MRIIRNERRIRTLSAFGRYVPWAALIVLAAGLVISYVRPEWLLPMVVSVILGIGFSIAGGRLAERYAGPLAHHAAIAAALKGLDDRHVLVQYILPAPHVLLDPGGCTVVAVKTHAGDIGFEEGRFKHRQKGRVFRQLAGQESIGLAHEESRELAGKVQNWLERNVSGVTVPVRAAIVFVSPQAKLDTAGCPVPTFYGKKIKAWLRGPGKRRELPTQDFRTLVEAVEQHGGATEA